MGYVNMSLKYANISGFKNAKSHNCMLRKLYDFTIFDFALQSALGLELWSMTDEIVFDNFIITDDRQLHETWVEQTWVKKSAAEASTSGGVSDVQKR